MSAILDLLYREYCRARLAEMRKQLMLSVTNDEIPAANWDAGDPVGPDRRDLDEEAQPSGSRVL